MENYENINKAESALSCYQNYRIKYKKNRRPVNLFLIVLIQLAAAAAVCLIVLTFKYVSVFEPAFNAVKDFIQKDIFENLILYIKSAA